MKARRDFLATLGATGASLALGSAARAKEPAAPSAAALATATAMRRFDPTLTGSEVETIARGIDDNVKTAAALNSKKNRLKNADEPVTIFVV